MISSIVSEFFDRIGHFWYVDGGTTTVTPSEDDVEKVLDRAAVALYDGAVGDRLEVGGLIIEKAEHGHDVYMYVGNYS